MSDFVNLVGMTATSCTYQTPPLVLTPDPDPEIASFYSKDLKVYNEMHHVDFTRIKPYGDMGDRLKDSISSWKDFGYWIRRQWLYGVCYWWDNLKDGISNLRTWFPIIWDDRDWDNHFLWEMLLFKLKRMSPAIRKHVAPGPHMVALDRAIYVLEELLKRSRCDCAHLHSFVDRKNQEQVDSRLKVCHSCYTIQKELLKEFSELFAEFSNCWWD